MDPNAKHRWKSAAGYIIVEWSHLGQHFRMMEHRYIAEKAMGHPLPEGAEVHHVNEDKSDNRNQNLVVCENRAYHMLLHARQRILAAGGDPDIEKICRKCGELKSRSEFHKYSKRYDGLRHECKACHIAEVIVSQREYRRRKRLEKACA